MVLLDGTIQLGWGGWWGGWAEIATHRDSIILVTCNILSLAENPRWSPSVAIWIFQKWAQSCSGRWLNTLVIGMEQFKRFEDLIWEI